MNITGRKVLITGAGRGILGIASGIALVGTPYYAGVKAGPAVGPS